MPRIPAVPAGQANWLIRFAYWMARRRYGAVPEPLAVAAHHPKLLMAGARHEMAVERAATTLPESLRDLVVYRAAVTLGCSWCVDFGMMLQRLKGLDVDRLAEMDDPASTRFTEDEKLAMAYADAMTATPVAVTDAQVAELDARFGHRGLVELTYLIALENLRARTNSALGIVDQGFSTSCEVRTERSATERSATERSATERS